MMIAVGNLLVSLLPLEGQRLNGQSFETVGRRATIVSLRIQ
jgi:hypothetical protein